MKSTDTLAVDAKANGRSDTTLQHHLSNIALAPQCSYIAVARHLKHRSQYLDSCESKYNAFFSSYVLSIGCFNVSSCTTRFPSSRVRIPDTLGGDNVEYQLTIDSATDIPCIAQTFICNHAKLRHNCVFPIPPGAISLRRADETPLEILGYIRFALELGKDRLAIAIRSLKDRCVTIVSLTHVLVLCVVGLWLVVLASSSILYGKVPRLFVKKTNRMTQAVVVFRKHFLCGALLCNCSSAEREGLSTHVQRECAAEPFMRSILSLRVFTSLPGSRLRFCIAMQIQYSY